MKVGAAQTSMLFRNVMRAKEAVHDAEKRAARATVMARGSDRYGASELTAPFTSRGRP